MHLPFAQAARGLRAALGLLAVCFAWAGVGQAAVPPVDPPVLVVQPKDREVETGDWFFLGVQVVPVTGISYAWYHNGSLATNGAVSNDGSSYAVSNVRQSTAAGVYWVVVSNAGGSVTSRVAQVTIRPPAPNPEHRGFRMVTLTETGSAVPGRPEILGDIVDSLGTRWLGEEVVFSAVSRDGQSMGLLAAGLGGVRTVLPAGRVLPGGLGVAAAYELPESDRADVPLMVMARTNGLPMAVQGLYRVDGDELVAIVDLKSPVPDGVAGERWVYLGSPVQRDERVAFVGQTTHRWGVFGWSPTGGLEMWIDTRTTLPSGRSMDAFTTLGWDGRRWAAAVWNQTRGFEAVVTREEDGPLEEVVAAGVPVPGSPDVVDRVDRLVVQDGRVWAAGQMGVLRWHQGVLEAHIREPWQVDAWGAVVSFIPDTVAVANPDVFLAAGPNPNYYAIAAGTNGPARILAGVRIDGRPTGYFNRASRPLAAAGDRIAVMVWFPSGALAVAANLGSVLRYERRDTGGVRLRVPDGHHLERARHPLGPWENVGTAPEVDVPASDGEGYFRLRRL